MGGRDGEEDDVGGVYREVVAGEKLVFTWAWRTTPDRCTHVIGLPAKNVEAVALNQQTRKMAAWMSHDRSVRLIRVYFDGFNVHS
jgi:uncharacterized protein YndB with AHSA1/START domain